MDEDAVMENGHETAYPDPTNNERTPYPLETTSDTSPSRYYTSWPGKPPSSTPASTGEFMSLADYFNLGNTTLRQTRTGLLEYGDYSGDDTEAEVEGDGRPGFTRAPLPGYHFLPEVDRFVSGKGIGQHASSSRSRCADHQGKTSRGSGGGRPRGSKAGHPRGWKHLLKGTDHEDLFSKPKGARKSTRKRRGRPRGGEGGEGVHRVDPGREFTEFQSKATQAFLNGNYEEALEFALLAVRANSEMYAAHHLVYQVLQLQGRERDAFEAQTLGAVTKRDAKLWVELAQRLLAFEGEDQRGDDVERAIVFYRTAIILDKGAYEPRVQKLSLYLDLEDWNKARRDCKAIVQKWPDELDKVMLYAELCERTADASEWQRAVTAYQEAFKRYADEESFGDSEQQWTHLNVYLDLMTKLERWNQGVHELKRIARWFLGRKDDTFWDEFAEDDREFDINHQRRIHMWQFQQGRISRNPMHYGEGLPMELRVKLGLFRLKMGARFHAEAFRHLEHLRAVKDEAEDFADMFHDVGDWLRRSALFGQAVSFLRADQIAANCPE